MYVMRIPDYWSPSRLSPSSRRSSHWPRNFGRPTVMPSLAISTAPRQHLSSFVNNSSSRSRVFPSTTKFPSDQSAANPRPAGRRTMGHALRRRLSSAPEKSCCDRPGRPRRDGTA